MKNKNVSFVAMGSLTSVKAIEDTQWLATHSLAAIAPKPKSSREK